MGAAWFEDPTLETPPVLTNTPMPQSPEELAHKLNGLDALQDWIDAVRAYAHAQAEGGVAIPGWQLAEKIGNRTWLDEAKTTKALKALKLTDDQIFKRKLISPARSRQDPRVRNRKEKSRRFMNGPCEGRTSSPAKKLPVRRSRRRSPAL